MKEEAGRILGAPVARAERVYGGYAPSATFRMRLADGRRAFFKGSYPLPAGSAVRWGVSEEQAVYRALGQRIRPWAPAFYGAFDRDGWHVLLLEDAGPADVLPWTPAKVRRAARDYAAFHAANAGARLPRSISRTLWRMFVDRWAKTDLARVAALARRRSDEALEWLDVAYPILRASGDALVRSRSQRTLLHLDTRSDNIRVSEGLRLFDWNFACVGPRELDVAAFAQSIPAEGGPQPERFVAAYRERLDLDQRLLGLSVAAIAGLFAQRAPEPPIEGLPRLRPFQRRQLKSSLAWAARLLDLPEPRWLATVPD
ncbi:MAG TPA: phosphotransferase [Candidatus Limnocylindria bacterium]|nr:phosphotransferase [Candidatus Limnocylindria bacterium]